MNKLIAFGFLIMPLGFFSIKTLKNPAVKNSQLFSTIYTQKNPGEIVYKKYCMSCHQADGSGVPNMAPPLTGTSFVLGEKRLLIKIVLNGLKNVSVNDETYNNPMPALGSVLKDQQIADVLTYIRNSFGNKATAITAAEVKDTRKQGEN